MAAEQVPAEIVELSPLKATSLRWVPRTGGPMLTVICKATFPLVPGLAELAAAQDDVNLRDLHAGNDTNKGLYSASDIAPYKRQADVTLVGRCYAAAGELAKELSPRLQVAGIDKRVVVHADRHFSRDTKLHDGNFFSKMAIGYERAAGGARTVNPVGIDMSRGPDEDGRTVAPNVQPVGYTLAVVNMPPPPAGFGPIAAAWPGRAELVGSDARQWLASDWSATQMPEQWHWGYFNVAPADQRVAALSADLQIALEHLHPEHPQLAMQLPGVAPCVFVDGEGQPPRQLAMVADTLWIDTNRLVVTLCWRGQAEIALTSRSLRALVAMCPSGQQLSYEQVCAMQPWEPPSSETLGSGDEAKTVARPRPAPPSKRGKTTPVPLVPSSDCTPAWMPPTSTLSGADGAPTVGKLEVPLTDGEVTQVQQLAKALGCSPQEALRHALGESYRKRFPR